MTCFPFTDFTVTCLSLFFFTIFISVSCTAMCHWRLPSQLLARFCVFLKMALDEIRLIQCALKLNSLCNVLEQRCYLLVHVLFKNRKIEYLQFQIKKKNSVFSNVKILAVSKCSIVPSLICFNLLANMKTFYSVCTNILQKC